MAVRKKSLITQRSLNALETKNKLLSTAMALFTKYGFDKVTVDDITRYAGVSKGTFYTHFSAKEEVLVEQYNKIDGYYEQVFRHIRPEATASERLLFFVDTMCSYCSEVCGLNLLKIVYMNQISLGKRPSILLNTHRPFYSYLAKFVTHGRESGEFTRGMPLEDQVYLFASAARSVLYEWCLHDGSIDLKELGRKHFQLILDHLRTGGSRGRTTAAK